MNRQKDFGTLDLITLVVLCGTVSSVVGASIAGLLHDDRPMRARQAAQTLAFQIRQQHDLALNSPSLSDGRMPASVGAKAAPPPLTDGQMGKDPWGRAYFYTVLGNPLDANTTVVVWSEGPDGKLQTKIDELSESTLRTFHFRGDDVGFISNAKYALVRDIRRNR